MKSLMTGWDWRTGGSCHLFACFIPNVGSLKDCHGCVIRMLIQVISEATGIVECNIYDVMKKRWSLVFVLVMAWERIGAFPSARLQPLVLAWCPWFMEWASLCALPKSGFQPHTEISEDVSSSSVIGKVFRLTSHQYVCGKLCASLQLTPSTSFSLVKEAIHLWGLFGFDLESTAISQYEAYLSNIGWVRRGFILVSASLVPSWTNLIWHIILQSFLNKLCLFVQWCALLWLFSRWISDAMTGVRWGNSWRQISCSYQMSAIDSVKIIKFCGAFE